MGRTKRAAGSVLLLFCSVVRSPLLCLEKHDQSSGQWPHRTEQKLFLVSLMKEVRVCTRPSLLHNSGGRSLFPGHQEPRQGQEAGRTGGGRSFRRGYKPTPSEASLFASPCAVARGRTCVPRPLFVVCSLAASAVAPDLRLCSLAAVPTPTPTRAGAAAATRQVPPPDPRPGGRWVARWVAVKQGFKYPTKVLSGYFFKD